MTIPSSATTAAAGPERLSEVEKERAKIAKAVALADDVPELVAEMNRRSARIRFLKEQIEDAKRTPDEIATKIRQAEESARSDPAKLRVGLAEGKHLREVLLTLFSDGLPAF